VTLITCSSCIWKFFVENRNHSINDKKNNQNNNPLTVELTRTLLLRHIIDEHFCQCRSRIRQYWNKTNEWRVQWIKFLSISSIVNVAIAGNSIENVARHSTMFRRLCHQRARLCSHCRKRCAVETTSSRNRNYPATTCIEFVSFERSITCMSSHCVDNHHAFRCVRLIIMIIIVILMVRRHRELLSLVCRHVYHHDGRLLLHWSDRFCDDLKWWTICEHIRTTTNVCLAVDMEEERTHTHTHTHATTPWL
jgi:hypothetical protein